MEMVGVRRRGAGVRAARRRRRRRPNRRPLFFLHASVHAEKLCLPSNAQPGWRVIDHWSSRSGRGASACEFLAHHARDGGERSFARSTCSQASAFWAPRARTLTGGAWREVHKRRNGHGWTVQGAGCAVGARAEGRQKATHLEKSKRVVTQERGRGRAIALSPLFARAKNARLDHRPLAPGPGGAHHPRPSHSPRGLRGRGETAGRTSRDQGARVCDPGRALKEIGEPRGGTVCARVCTRAQSGPSRPTERYRACPSVCVCGVCEQRCRVEGRAARAHRWLAAAPPLPSLLPFLSQPHTAHPSACAVHYPAREGPRAHDHGLNSYSTPPVHSHSHRAAHTHTHTHTQNTQK